jgi:hypothetical protein
LNFQLNVIKVVAKGCHLLRGLNKRCPELTRKSGSKCAH